MHLNRLSVSGFARSVALLPVHVYRRLISPLIAPRCRYYPTCSTYALEAIRTYGVFRGGVLAAWRVIRCNPFSDGGVDHVCDQKLFSSRSESADLHDHAGDHVHGVTPAAGS
ncbi:MAG: membrane protein insertion efficiency factor YidD [Actinobacteria bacterium]|nr:membrane protein insertion efficiency factor YidD [Actinomycetota bacterium]